MIPGTVTNGSATMGTVGVVSAQEHNPHAGTPFTDDDATIAAYLEDVCVPALMCSLVHMTGDPSWIRGELRPQAAVLNDFTFGMPAEMRAEVLRRAVPAIAAYRDGGCVPFIPDEALATEMMGFLGCAPLDTAVVPMFLEDLHLDGRDSGAITWAEEIPAAVKDDAHVVVIGCGESGILAGIRLSEAGLPFTIVEKSDGPGGTWWDSRYPGARVDIGSHFYCYSFEPADRWSEYFVRQPELRDYFADVVDRHDLRRHCRFGTEVVAARFDEPSARWVVTVRDRDGHTDTIDARFVISGVGALNLPKMPDIPGMDSFAGPSFHSARWDSSVDYRGKRFALVGAGASGFQIAPTIADDVAELTIFQRTPQWMFPNLNYHRQVPPGDAWALHHLPFYGRWFRFMMFYPAAGLSMARSRIDPDFHDPEGMAVNELNARTVGIYRDWITSQLADRPDLIELSLPYYPPSAKRMLQDNGSWLACLKKPNVTLVRTGIERITPDGVLTADGTLHPADVICYATGFRHSEFLAPIRFTGRGGVDLHDRWGDAPTAYLGITIPGFPNLFCLYGPGTNLAHGASLIFHSECQVQYAMDAIHRVLSEGRSAIEVRPDVHDAYAERYMAEIAQMVWAHPSVAHSHFKNPEGKIFTLSPWPIPDYWRWTRAVDPADYVLS